jgi:hypothetical protein
MTGRAHEVGRSGPEKESRMPGPMQAVADDLEVARSCYSGAGDVSCASAEAG